MTKQVKPGLQFVITDDDLAYARIAAAKLPVLCPDLDAFLFVAHGKERAEIVAEGAFLEHGVRNRHGEPLAYSEGPSGRPVSNGAGHRSRNGSQGLSSPTPKPCALDSGGPFGRLTGKKETGQNNLIYWLRSASCRSAPNCTTTLETSNHYRRHSYVNDRNRITQTQKEATL